MRPPHPGSKASVGLLLAGLLAAETACGQPPAGYYGSAESLSGTALRQALHEIIDDHRVWSYADAHRWVDMLDEDATNASNVWQLYARSSVPKSTWPAYNREHTWPQSLGAMRRPAQSDMHHIFAEDASVNSSRGNKPYDNCLSNCRSHPEAPAARYTPDTWEPPDEVKGDIARALFYMDVRYAGDGGEPDLVLREELPTGGCDCMGRLSTLLAWHVLDPVDAVERRRNDLVYSQIQGNRNPFVDRPEWVAAIWGGTAVPSPVVAIQESVELRAEHPDGVPMHGRVGGGGGLSRIATGTIARVQARAEEGRWLQVTVPDGRSGWINRRYVAAFLAAGPPGGATPQPADGQASMLLHFIDVGQANATLLEFPCGAILIDAGAQGDAQRAALIAYLQAFFARRPDLVNTLESIVITHNHIDHTRALREVVSTFRVRRIIEHGMRGGPRDPGDPPVDWAQSQAAARGIRFRVVRDSEVRALPTRQGLADVDIDPVNCAGVDPRIRVLSASIAEADRPNWPSGEFENKNNHSIVTRVDFGEASFLFTGDLEEPAIESLVNYYSGTDLLDVDGYEVGHHGSHNGTTFSLLNAMSPQLAVISMSRWNDQQPWTAWQYGHPRHEAVSLLRDTITETRNPPLRVHIANGQRAFYEVTLEDAIYATGWEGTVLFRAYADGRVERLLGPIP